MRSVAWLIAALLRLLNLYKESLELRCPRVGVDHCGRQEVSRSHRCFVLIFRDAAVAPVDGNADLKGFLAVDRHGLDSFGYHCLGNVSSSSARDLELLTAANAHVIGQLGRNLDEGLRNKLNVHRIVL